MELYNLTIHETHELLKNREVSVIDVVKSVFDRIDNVEDKIGSYITLCRKEAIKKAEHIQSEYMKRGSTTPLSGIPMCLKDIMCTKGVKTTCASKMLENFVPPYDSTVSSKLSDAGAILIGKTNMDEFAMGSSTEKSYYKKTHNPWDIERVPGGSSGGSASAVAAGEAFFSLGSDTGGSIRQPSSFCGIVGMKPTYGTVSRYGVVSIASSLDHIGPMTKDVTDAALVLNAIAGHDGFDATSANVKHPDFTKSLINDVKRLKIGVPKEYMGNGIDIQVRQAIYGALETLRAEGAEYEEISLPMSEYAIPSYYIICGCEASSNLAKFDGIRYGYCAKEYSDIDELYKNSRSEGFGSEVKRRIMLGTYVLGENYYEKYYVKSMKIRTLIKREFENALEKYDVIVTPVSPTTAFKFGEKSKSDIQMYMEDLCTVSANIAGVPAITVPCGFDDEGLPIGLQIIGKAFDESTLIRTAYTFEQNTEFHNARAQIK